MLLEMWLAWRQFWRFGKSSKSPLVRSQDWTRPSIDDTRIVLDDVLIDDDVDAPTRAAVAAQWREKGRARHASVAALAQRTIDLVAVGAPPRLVADTQRASLEAIHHAQLCFALARAIDGKAEGPGPTPSGGHTLSRSRTVALAELAVASLVDALHEDASTRIAAKLARRAPDPSIRAILNELASGSAARESSELHWEIVRYCLAEGGTPVEQALASATIPPSPWFELPAGAADGGWERWGIEGSALQAAESHFALRAQFALSAPAPRLEARQEPRPVRRGV